MKKTLIREARIYDPAQQWRGESRDLYLRGEKISEPFSDPDQVIDASGRCLMAAGVEPNCLFAAPGQGVARWTHGAPDPREIGRAYARMGYVHVHHPFTTLLTAGLVHRTLGRLPYLDTSASVSIDLRDMAPAFRANQPEDFCRQARALIKVSGALGLLLPFPFLRHRQRHYLHKNLSPKKVLGFVSVLQDEEILPVTLWGTPDMMEAEIPEPHRFHICGLGAALSSETAAERASAILDAGASADLGPPHRADLLAVTSEASVTPGSLTVDVGLHRPFHYRCSPHPLVDDLAKGAGRLLEGLRPEWRLALSASGPFGSHPGPFSESTVRLLCHPSKGLDLYEWAERTRHTPARTLGLHDLGNLCPGSSASVVIYDLQEGSDVEKATDALSDCWCLIKDGVLVRDQAGFTGDVPPARTRYRDPDVDLSEVDHTDLFQNPTLRAQQLRVCVESSNGGSF